MTKEEIVSLIEKDFSTKKVADYLTDMPTDVKTLFSYLDNKFEHESTAVGMPVKFDNPRVRDFFHLAHRAINGKQYGDNDIDYKAIFIKKHGQKTYDAILKVLDNYRIYLKNGAFLNIDTAKFGAGKIERIVFMFPQIYSGVEANVDLYLKLKDKEQLSDFELSFISEVENIIGSNKEAEGEYVYHGTKDEFLESIAKEGLKVGTKWATSGRIFLANDEKLASTYGRILRIKKSVIVDLNKSDRSKRAVTLDVYETKQPISPNDIEIKTENGWLPLVKAVEELVEQKEMISNSTEEILQKKKANELRDELLKNGFFVNQPNTSITNFGVSTYIGFYDEFDVYRKFRISDHSVTNTHRIWNEYHYNQNSDVSKIVEQVKKDIEETKQDVSIKTDLHNKDRERTKLANEKWERVKDKFKDLCFKTNSRTYQDLSKFSENKNRTNIYQKALDNNRYGETPYYYEWTEPKNQNEYCTERPSREYIENYISEELVEQKENKEMNEEIKLIDTIKYNVDGEAQLKEIYQYGDSNIQLLYTSENKKLFQIAGLFVQEKDRRSGIGSRLIDFAKSRAAELGFDEILYLVADYEGKDYDDLVSFVKKNGFEFVGDSNKKMIFKLSKENKEMTQKGSVTNDELDKALSDLHKAEKLQETMKKANAIIRSKKNVTERLINEAGMSESSALKAQQPDYAGRVGFATYQLTNNNASIKRLQERVKMLEKKVEGAKAAESGAEEKYTFDGGVIKVNYEEDRVQILLDSVRADKPMYQMFRKNGYVFSPTNKAFQRKITPQAIRNAVSLMKAVKVDEELSKGISVEKEHQETINKIASGEVSPKDAPEAIAKDHIKEDENYYDKLEVIEPNTGNEFDEAVLAKIDPKDQWKGRLMAERDVKRQIYSQLTGEESEKEKEVERLFQLYASKFEGELHEQTKAASEKMNAEFYAENKDKYYNDEKGEVVRSEINELKEFMGFGIKKTGSLKDGDHIQYEFDVHEISKSFNHRLVGTIEKNPDDKYSAMYMNEMYEENYVEKDFKKFEDAEKWVLSSIEKDIKEYKEDFDTRYEKEVEHEVKKEGYNFNNLIKREDVSIKEVFQGENIKTIKFEWNGSFYKWAYSFSKTAGSLKVWKFPTEKDLMSNMFTTGVKEEIIYNTFNTEQTTDEGSFIEFSVSKWNLKEFFKESELDKISVVVKQAEPITDFKGVNYSYKNQYELNKAIEALLIQRAGTTLYNDSSEYTSDEKNFIRKYSGYGGLDKYGTTGKGGLFEYYTPKEIIERMWALAYKYGYNNGSVLEPSIGIGEFLQYAPKDARIVGYEINEFSAKICKILYPTAEVNVQPFEKTFISKNNWTMKDNLGSLQKFDLVIGNPPYGDFSIVESRYMSGMGEKDHTKARNYVEYFIRRGLDLLKSGGLLIYIVGAQLKNGGNMFLDSGETPVKDYLAANCELLDAYRLPDSVFERTGVTSDIIVLKKR